MPINAQFKDEMARLQRFDCDVAGEGSCRLIPGAFYFKLVKRNAGLASAGILISPEHYSSCWAKTARVQKRIG